MIMNKYYLWAMIFACLMSWSCKDDDDDNQQTEIPVIQLEAPAENERIDLDENERVTFSWKAPGGISGGYTLMIGLTDNLSPAKSYTVNGLSWSVSAANFDMEMEELSIPESDEDQTVYWSVKPTLDRQQAQMPQARSLKVKRIREVVVLDLALIAPESNTKIDLNSEGVNFSWNDVGLAGGYRLKLGFTSNGDLLGDVIYTSDVVTGNSLNISADDFDALLRSHTEDGVTGVFLYWTVTPVDEQAPVATHVRWITVEKKHPAFVQQWMVSTVAGALGTTTAQTGTLEQTTFGRPLNLAIDNNNNLIVMDKPSGDFRYILINEAQNLSTTIYQTPTLGIMPPLFVGNKLLTAIGEEGPACRYMWLENTGSGWTHQLVNVQHPATTEEGDNFAYSWGNNAAYNPADGMIYLSDGNELIRVDPATAKGRRLCSLPVNATSYMLFHPSVSNLLYIAYTGINGGSIYTCDVTAGTVELYSGAVKSSASVNGPRLDARFRGISQIAFGPDESLFVAEIWGHAIRRISPDGEVTTIAGNNGAGFLDGSGESAKFNEPLGIAVDKDGKIYVADCNSRKIRKVALENVPWVE
jgi:hypothetical protein